jgi:ABC-2 type transport system ATP-binding protein
MITSAYIERTIVVSVQTSYNQKQEIENEFSYINEDSTFVFNLENITKNYRKTKRKRVKKGFNLNQRIFGKKVSSDIKALDNVSLSAKYGEVIAILGANGAGKSTLIKILLGIIQPDSGNVSIFNQSPMTQRTDLMRKVGVIFGHRSQLWRHVPIKASFDFASKIYNVNPDAYKKRLDFLDNYLDIKSLYGKSPRHLSFGQRIRCEIAFSLIHKPKFLVYDEATIGLDVLAREKIINLLKFIATFDQTTIILASHIISDVNNLAERVVLLNKGSVEFDGSLANFKKKFSSNKVCSLSFSRIKNIELYHKLIDKYRLKVQGSSISGEVSNAENSYGNFIEETMKAVEVTDIHVGEAPLEEIVKGVFDSI